ncbi:hypothetical protein NOR51B_1750 [Luminiphilus syltensis NOR5-1B]|uniref:Uncharacterized protein n=1 Tax=Luminiphilus syltensis NOR5-1B TaxID=565045 RepID=B8KWW1_9GAMM|nr:hypothetical protein NOR51B_1750 [Luminiphilus syltensis NOR5-1B]
MIISSLKLLVFIALPTITAEIFITGQTKNVAHIELDSSGRTN